MDRSTDGALATPLLDKPRTGGSRDTTWAEVNPHHFVVASSITSFFEAATLYPFDVIKTRQQVGNSGFRRVAADLWKRAGVKGLYKGFSWSVVGGVPSDVAFWLSYNVFKEVLLQHTQIDECLVHLCAGAAAEVVGLSLYLPLDIISQRVQAQALPGRPPPRQYHQMRFKRFDGGVQVARLIAREDGLKGFWRGFGVSVGSQVPASAVSMMGYEWFKGQLPQRLPMLTEGHPATHVIAGGLAGTLAVVVTNPVDVLKTRMQVSQENKSLSHLVNELMVADGVKGFGRGILPRILSFAPRNAMAFVLYEVSMSVASPSQRSVIQDWYETETD